MYQRKNTPGRLTKLEAGEIYVFGGFCNPGKSSGKAGISLLADSD